MTLDVYAGLFDDDLTALADRMDAAARAAAERVWARCGRDPDRTVRKQQDRSSAGWAP
jgi:hypothetical protein